MGISSATTAAIEQQFPGARVSEFRGQSRWVIDRGALTTVCSFLRDDCGFDLLVDVTCVDYLQYRGATHRFGLVYLICNVVTSERLTLRVMLEEDCLSVPSLVPLWEGANWLEREVWDMFGIRFDGHPDLRRILLPEEFTAYPLRKDYPRQGRGERHNFPVLRRGQA